MAKVEDIKKVLRVEQGSEITLKQLQDAKEIYKQISQDAFKSKEKNWTQTNLALAELNRSFMDLMKTDQVKDLARSIFIGEKGGYNVSLAEKTETGYKQVLSVKFKSSDDIETLINDFNFYLNV